MPTPRFTWAGARASAASTSAAATARSALRYKDYHTSGFNQAVELYSVDKNWRRHDHAIGNLDEHGQNTARSFTQLYADFRDAIHHNRPPIAPGSRANLPPISIESAARALHIALGAYISGVTGQVVDLPLDSSHPVYQKGIDGMVDLHPKPGSKTAAAGLFGFRPAELEN